MRSESTESTTPARLQMHHRARIARRHPLHAGADVRRVGAQQRNRLALHVRSHQRAVGVVVLEERNQARGHRDELLRADVHVLDFVAMLQHEVAGLARVHQIGDDAALLIELDVGLGDDVLVFFPRREVFAVGFELGGGCFLPPSLRFAFSTSARQHTRRP